MSWFNLCCGHFRDNPSRQRYYAARRFGETRQADINQYINL